MEERTTKNLTYHCFFEQSGTFKNEFKKLGYNAIDYDILNDYGQTDVQIDLFAEIEKAYKGEESVFESVKEGEYIIAFFPCTLFQEHNALWFKGCAAQQGGWNVKQKLEYCIERHEELHRNYTVLSKLVIVAIDRNIPLVIENPATPPHYLSTYWCVKPKFVDQDRTERGDWMKKPTQYWFINCEPKNNFIFEPQIVRKAKKYIDIKGGNDRQKTRSEITPEYANRFIREFILDGAFITELTLTENGWKDTK